MRIALLTDGIYPYVIGGMQKHSFYLAKFFALNNVYVDLYHCASNTHEAALLNCFTDEEKQYIHPILIPFQKTDNLPGHYIREMYAYSSEIYFQLKKREVDFIYVQGLCGMKLIENKKEVKVPVGINFHGLEMFQKAANIKSKAEQYIFRKPVRKSLNNADYVYSLGGKLTELLIKIGIAKHKIIQIPIGIDSSWIRKTELKNNDVIRFVFVGRYERRKGIVELMKAINLLVDRSFEFHFIGAIPESIKLHSSKIYYWGSLSDVEQIKNILKSADVLVCPSYSEGMPTVILEAMASGLAIISSNVGAVSELVNFQNGILIEPGNVDELQKAMKSFIEMPPELLMGMKKSSIKSIEKHFLWQDIIQKTIENIKAVI